jgi:transcriptional regulator with XRE-family HTH domain
MLGERIKRLREAAGWSQAELARRCGWGEDAQGRVGNYESKVREPNLGDIARLADVLGVPPGELAFGVSGWSAEELELVAAFRRASEAERAIFRGMVGITRQSPRIPR